MMQDSAGLLGSFSQGMPSAPAAGGAGLLGSMGAPASGGLKMAQRLSQSPTPATAQQIIQELHQMKSPEAAQFEQILTQVMNDPQALKQVADSVVQKLSGANA